MPFSTYYSTKILTNIFASSASIPTPSQIWIGLLTVDPETLNGSDSNLTVYEVSGDTYKRVLIHNRSESVPKLVTVFGRTATSNAQINWVKANAKWPDVKGFFLATAETNGEIIYYGKLTKNEKVTVEAGAVALFEAGAFQITLSATDEAIAST